MNRQIEMQPIDEAGDAPEVSDGHGLAKETLRRVGRGVNGGKFRSCQSSAIRKFCDMHREVSRYET
jgi:hypothetical protein